MQEKDIIFIPTEMDVQIDQVIYMLQVNYRAVPSHHSGNTIILVVIKNLLHRKHPHVTRLATMIRNVNQGISLIMNLSQTQVPESWCFSMQDAYWTESDEYKSGNENCVI